MHVLYKMPLSVHILANLRLAMDLACAHKKEDCLATPGCRIEAQGASERLERVDRKQGSAEWTESSVGRKMCSG